LETYILWSVSFAEPTRELSFFATTVNINRIQQGTTVMLTNMLADLGLGGISFTGGSVEHFITHYLMDTPPSDDWRDQWADTWEITVQLAAPVTLAVEATTLIRTYARDTSWKGDRTFHPARCVIVADFYSPEALRKALPILSQISHLHVDPSLLDKVHNQVPFVAREIFVRIQEAYRARNTDVQQLSIRQRPGLAKQLFLELGRFEETFFAQGARLAHAVADLVYELDGTTTWDATTDPNQYS
jgi:hypothetical protein